MSSARIIRLEERLRGVRIPWHLPIRQWPEAALDRVCSPGLLQTLTDAELDRLITELDAWIDD